MRIEETVAARMKMYGHPLKNFSRIAAIKAVLADCGDAEVLHALEMIAVKMVRLVETPDHQDSIDDIQGYARTINMIHEQRRKGNPVSSKPPSDAFP